MSGIAAVFQRNGQPAHAGLVKRMVEAMRHRGPDGLTQWINGSIGLGHCLMRTTPESLNEHYPLGDGTHWIAWDGRLDNRDELLATLTTTRISVGDQTDPELALGAYRMWGTRCAKYLLGEFAFVLWDERTRTLFGARDRFGLKPFYYCERDARTLLIASEAKPLLSVLDRMPDPDDELILAMLLSECRESDNHRSLFAGVHRLPPGHVFIATNERLHVERYWQIDPSHRTIYKQPEAYVEHFRALFEEAVRCRTRSAFPVGCFLSGGLDSSAITTTAALMSRAAVEAFTLFSDDPASDERQRARTVARAADVPLWELYCPASDSLEGLDELLWKVECPILSPDQHGAILQEAVRPRGCRVMLDGDGGDQLLDETGYLADLLVRTNPFRFLRETSAFAQWYGVSPRAFVLMAAREALPVSLKAFAESLIGRIPPAWINRTTATSVNLAARLQSPRVPGAWPSLSQRVSYQDALSPYFLLKLELGEREAAHAGWEIAYPFLDSRLVEFIVSIPWHQRCHDGERKWLLRQACKDVLPDVARQGRGKGDWTNGMDRALVARCSTTSPAPLANRSGMMERYIDQQGARRLVARYLGGRHNLRWDVWSLVTLDHWLARFWKGGTTDGEGTTHTEETVYQPDVALVR